MNERIQELAVKAGIKGNDVYYSRFYDGVNRPDMEKFAELIVRECFECIDIMEKIAASNNCSIPVDYDKHTYLETLDTMRGLLGAHFGVE